MCGNPHNSDATKSCETVVLELLGDCPWDQIAGGSQSSFQLLLHGFLLQLALIGDLDGTKDVWGAPI